MSGIGKIEVVGGLPNCPFCGGDAELTNRVADASIECADCHAKIVRAHEKTNYDQFTFRRLMVAWCNREKL